MNQVAGIVRSASNLQKGLDKILTLKDRFYSQIRILPKNELNNDNHIRNLIITLEVRSSLIVCEAIIKSAFIRKESRGAHFRSDFPTIDNDAWRVNIYCTKEDGKMILYKQNVKEVKGTLKEVIRNHSKPIHNNESE